MKRRQRLARTLGFRNLRELNVSCETEQVSALLWSELKPKQYTVQWVRNPKNHVYGLHYYRVIKKSLCAGWFQYRKLQVMFKVSPASLHTADRQSQEDTRLTPTPSVIPNSDYVIMVTGTV
jgi:hypothetical protein